LRRALRKQLPAFSYHFGIHPWDIERLTYGEIETYLDALADLNKSGGS
jgi:hypothetical protein